MKYLVKGKTTDGYYLEVILMMLSGSFNGNFKARIERHGICFYENNVDMMIDVYIKGFDKYVVDESQIGRELVVESTKKNHQLSNNKKRDSASIFIKEDKPNNLVLRIGDSVGVVAMDIVYTIKNVEDDTQKYVVPKLKYENPITTIETGEMTKSVKVITKASAKLIVTKFQKMGINLIAVDETNSVPINVKIGKCLDEFPYKSIQISKDAFKSVMKFYNLSKKLNLYVTEDYYCMTLKISNGLGIGTVIFKGVDGS
jgi:hypothetical protein